MTERLRIESIKVDGEPDYVYGITEIDNPFLGKIERWDFLFCYADVCVEDDWATLYSVESKNPGNGECQILLKAIKTYYEGKGKKFGGTVALNPTMQHIYKKLGIEEFS